MAALVLCMALSGCGGTGLSQELNDLADRVTIALYSRQPPPMGAPVPTSVPHPPANYSFKVANPAKPDN